MSEEFHPRLSPDQITDMLHEMARSGEPAERRFAIKLIKPAEAQTGLPEPLDAADCVMRLARVMRGIGEKASREAMSAAFKSKVVDMDLDERPNIDRQVSVKVPTNLSDLYRMFPEAPKDLKTGAPPGYPKVGPMLKKRRWVYDYAVELLKRREQQFGSPLKVDAGAIRDDGSTVTEDAPA